MTDKPKKSTKAMKATQLETLNAIVDKQTAQLKELTELMGSIKVMVDTVIAADKDEKCSCKDSGCSCDITSAAIGAALGTQYPGNWEDLIKQWNDIQPNKSKSTTEREQEQKKETNEHGKIVDEIHTSHQHDFLTMLNKIDKLLNNTKCKCACDCTDDWEILKGAESEEYDNAFTRFSLDSNDDVTVALHVSSGDCGYNITCTLDYDDNNYSINILTNELDKDVLESLFMKITKAFDSFEVDFTISDFTKIATKLHQLFDSLS
jgi:hypothetical protein